MLKNSLLIVALALTGAVAVWGIVDTEGLATFASTIVRTMFRSRGWFIMLTVSAMLILCFWLAFSR
jgi:glycine betaine transporter